MTDRKTDTKAILGDFTSDTASGLWRWVRRSAVYTAAGAILLGAVTHVMIGDLWFGVKMGALLGFIASLGFRALRDGFFD